MDIQKPQSFSKKLINFSLIFLLTTICVFLQGCASSDLSRDATNNVQSVYQDGVATFTGSDQASPAQAYRNSSQATKGALIGGATGAIAGGMTSGVGIVPGAASGAIFGGALGAYIDSKTTLEDKLENRGCKAIVLGDQILIVLPSRYIFNGASAEFSPYAYSTLDIVARLISKYPNINVKIAAYTNPVGGGEQVNLALSQDQANNVERYLWRAGANTRLLTAAGFGGAKPVMRPELEGSEDNNRVEITLEKLPV